MPLEKSLYIEKKSDSNIPLYFLLRHALVATTAGGVRRNSFEDSHNDLTKLRRPLFFCPADDDPAAGH